MKLVLGVTGASGSIYAFRMLSVLSELGSDISLIITKKAMGLCYMVKGGSIFINLVSYFLYFSLHIYNRQVGMAGIN